MKRKKKREEGWYEVVDTAVDSVLIRNVKEVEGYRCFFLGAIGKLVLVEVPADMPEKKRDALGRALSAEGVSVLIVTDRVRFMRLRRASPEEEKKLNAATKEDVEARSSAAGRNESVAEDLRDGPVVDGDGDCDAGSWP